MKRLTLLLAALALAACASVAPGAAGPTAALGQAANVDGLRVRPLEVIEDSRCPTDVQCIWAGRVRILAEVGYRGGSETLRSEMILDEPLSVAGGRLTLIGAEPGTVAGRPNDRRAYRFTFAFTR